jgi:hypothetical protein
VLGLSIGAARARPKRGSSLIMRGHKRTKGSWNFLTLAQGVKDQCRKILRLSELLSLLLLQSCNVALFYFCSS